ncbi:hypothetical protein ABEO75_18775 [Paenibacillus macerans]|uniref:hypothetical protein n=1 Tax=Paenibacillus macerans TaxID=44252 RepID=UPI003D2CBBA1
MQHGGEAAGEVPEEALALDYACTALLAEGRGKAQADSLKKMHAGGQAGRPKWPKTPVCPAVFIAVFSAGCVGCPK